MITIAYCHIKNFRKGVEKTQYCPPHIKKKKINLYPFKAYHSLFSVRKIFFELRITTGVSGWPTLGYQLSKG